MGGENDIHNGWYVAPGGKTERGERGIDCITREYKEETGLLVRPKLKVIATFYNEGRVLGTDKEPDDWCVEVFSAQEFSGDLRDESSRAKLHWIPDSELSGVRMYPGDRKIMGLLDQEGVYEAIAQYRGDELVRFEFGRVD
jgi:8-oxo-dGTP diphosphatase